MRKDNLPRNDDGKLQTYAWPGGYPIYYLDNHNNVLCPDCAREADVENLEEDQRPVAAYVHWEGSPLICDECNAEIESAYGDSEEDKDSA